jgi:hypothetical protein
MGKGWVVRNVYARKKSEWWKFSTVGRDGRGREVMSLGEDGSEMSAPKCS